MVIGKTYYSKEIKEEEIKKINKELKLLGELFVIEKTKIKMMMIFP